MKKIAAVMTALVLILVPILGLAQIDSTASELLHAMQKYVRETDNITVAGEHTFSLLYNGTPTTITYHDLTVTFHDPHIIHNMVDLENGEKHHLYFVQMGDEMVCFASQGTEEYQSYAEEIHQDELSPETMGELDSITHPIDAMVEASIAGEEEVTVNGTAYQCIRIEITTHVLDFVEELVHNALLANPAFDDAWSDEIEASLADMTMPMTYWIEKETGILIQYASDVTDLYAGVYAYIPDKLDGGAKYTEYKHTYQVVGVNDAEEIMIPAKYIAYTEH